jgi:hypothetical protein
VATRKRFTRLQRRRHRGRSTQRPAENPDTAAADAGAHTVATGTVESQRLNSARVSCTGSAAACGLTPGVRLNPGGNLSLHQCPYRLLGRPAVGRGCRQDLRCTSQSGWVRSLATNGAFEMASDRRPVPHTREAPWAVPCLTRSGRPPTGVIATHDTSSATPHTRSRPASHYLGATTAASWLEGEFT